MKKLLPLLVMPALMAACADTPRIGAPQSAAITTDTAGLAEFHAWKYGKAMEDTKANTVYIVRERPKPRRAAVSQPVSSSHEAVEDVPVASQPEQSQKKGWSKAAKGAAIGAGSGAVLGAVIHKRNPVVGGVVGGAVGAGVGFGIGRHMDKKDGRY